MHFVKAGLCCTVAHKGMLVACRLPHCGRGVMQQPPRTQVGLVVAHIHSAAVKVDQRAANDFVVQSIDGSPQIIQFEGHLHILCTR